MSIGIFQRHNLSWIYLINWESQMTYKLDKRN
jgi:hypothetical protein